MRIVAVSELAHYLKDLMAEDYLLQDVWVRGEITNYTQSAAGHRYFSLKDETAAIRCVLFAGRGATVPPLRQGMAVVAHGRMSIYEARGDMQFYVDAVEDAGQGLLHLRFEALKAELEAEGLFDPERKRPIPAVPTVIGVVTSASAAALRDIVRTLRIRCPMVRVLLAPTLVQGEGAAEQIAAALDMLNAQGEAEVLILARGGGSLEELWAFNEAVVARAIARSAIPVVTGVGHETDFTIADFVADLRASTPTAAATMVAPDMQVWRDGLAQVRQRLEASAFANLAYREEQLATLGARLNRESPVQHIDDARLTLDTLERDLTTQFTHLLALRRERLRSRALQLHSLSPLATLGRGFAVVRQAATGEVLTRIGQVTPGMGLSVQFGDGSFAATAGPRISALPDAPDVSPSGQMPAAGADGAPVGADGDAAPARTRRRGRNLSAHTSLSSAEDQA